MVKVKVCYKSYIFVKVLRANLTGTWEGGGFRVKKTRQQIFDHKCISTSTPLESRVNYFI